VPQPTGIVLIALLGWWPCLLAALLALGARRGLRRVRPGLLARLEREKHQPVPRPS